MPKLKPGTIMPTPQEDTAINTGIAADPDARELDRDWFKSARPARDVLPELIGKQAAESLLKKRGRPPGENNKVATNVRYDRDLVEAFKATGEGWQTRMNDALRDWAKSHGLIHQH